MKNIRVNNAESYKKTPLCPSTRLSVYLLSCTVGILNYAVRLAPNMTIVCMVVPPQQQSNLTQGIIGNHTLPQRNGSIEGQCENIASENRNFGYKGEFTWSRSQVGYILSGFYYGYLPMQLLSGWLADRFGVRHVVGIGTLIGGILCLLTPVVARLHYGLLIALRLVMGFVMGTIFPSFQSFIGKWVPLSERITFVGVLFTGPPAGQMIAFVLSGYLCQFSWTLVFYVLGSVILVWYAAFMYIVYNTPDDHPRISEEEKAYIMCSNKLKSQDSKTPMRIPWKSILTSRSVIAACTTSFSYIWLLYTVITGIPLYMQDVLYFNIKSNGMLSSLGPLCNMCLGIPIALLLDFIFLKIIKSTFIMRKLCATLYFLISVSSITSLGFMQCEQRIQAIALSALIPISYAFLRAGLTLTPSDIAPQMAGTVFGFMNFVGHLAGILVPIAIGNLTPNGSQAEWQRVFFLTAGLVTFGWLVYMLFVSAEEQDWAKRHEVTELTQVPRRDDTPEEKTNNEVAQLVIVDE